MKLVMQKVSIQSKSNLTAALIEEAQVILLVSNIKVMVDVHMMPSSLVINWDQVESIFYLHQTGSLKKKVKKK